MKKTDFFQAFFNPAIDMDVLKETLLAKDPKECEHVLRVAEQTLRHSFVFDMEMDLERVTKPVEFGELIDWRYRPGDDMEFTWQFNRHRFFLCLGQAYLMTGDEKYAKEMTDLMQQFITREPLCEDNRGGTWRILDVGIRMGNWIKSLYCIQDSSYITEELLDTVYASLIQHCEHIVAGHTAYCYAGNWGVLENHGMFLASVLLPEIHSENNDVFRFPDSLCVYPQSYKTASGKVVCSANAQHTEGSFVINPFVYHAIMVLSTALQVQILPDGMQLEQSPMYHNEMLRCILEVAYFAILAKFPLPDTFLPLVRKMADTSLKLIKPNGHQLSMGDSDDFNIKPIMALAAVVFNEPTYKFASGSLTYDNLWQLHIKGIKEYDALPAQAPDFTNVSLYDSGQYIIRSGWDVNADYFHMDGGMLGSSHGHSDTLHIDWMVNGVDVLIDPGRKTYVNNPERFEFKGVTAHNTLMVDGHEFDEWNDSWFSKTVSAQSKQPMICRSNGIYFQAGHSGYMTLDNPVWVNRKVLHIKPDLYVIVDECYTSGTHTYKQYFHFDQDGSVTLSGNQILFESMGVEVCVYLDDKGSASLYDSYQSRHYNEKSPNRSVVLKSTNTGFHSLWTVCAKGSMSQTIVENKQVYSYISREPVASELAEAIKITHQGKVFLVLMAHTSMKGPIDLYRVDDCIGCGNVILWEPGQSPLSYTTFNW
jgi:hypothetical protein